MKKFNELAVGLLSSFCLSAAQLPVALNSAGNFVVLAGSAVTNTGPTLINGGLGLSPGTSVGGFPPGVVSPGPIHAADSTAAQAQVDLTAAFNDAAGRVLPTVVSGDLGGQTLYPGLYKSTTTLGITGTLTLDGQGNANSVFIFQVGSGLTTASGSQIVLAGGAQAANIFWQIGSSATLGTTSIFNGTILAQASVTVTTGAALNGRALARTGAVTLDSNTVVNPGPPTLGNPPGPLSVTCPAASAQIGVPYNSLISATGGTPPYTFSITGSLPQFLSLNPSTGAITGTTAQGAASTFIARATDSVAGTSAVSCTITPVPFIVPVIQPTPAPASGILLLIGFACMLIYRRLS